MMQTPVIVDGSFEDVPSSDLIVTDITSGGWTISGNDAVFEDSRFFSTPYGSNLVFLGDRTDASSVSQEVTLNCKPGAYTLSYAFQLLPPRPFMASDFCTMSVTYAGATIDSFVIASSDQGGPWTTRTADFTPAVSSGTLQLKLDCTTASITSEFDILLDNISIT
jgi:hypothetical protein